MVEATHSKERETERQRDRETHRERERQRERERERVGHRWCVPLPHPNAWPEQPRSPELTRIVGTRLTRDTALPSQPASEACQRPPTLSLASTSTIFCFGFREMPVTQRALDASFSEPRGDVIKSHAVVASSLLHGRVRLDALLQKLVHRGLHLS